jgi:hypothetical protein
MIATTETKSARIELETTQKIKVFTGSCADIGHESKQFLILTATQRTQKLSGN